jgi:hypothetical protein
MNAATVIESMEKQIMKLLNIGGFSEVTITSSSTRGSDGDDGGSASVTRMRQSGGKGKGKDKGKGKECTLFASLFLVIFFGRYIGWFVERLFGRNCPCILLTSFLSRSLVFFFRSF